MDDQFQIKAPNKCIHCKKTHVEMKKKFGVGLLRFQLPESTFVFFQCPFCHGLMGNTEAAANAIKLKKMNERRVIPARPGNVLTI